MSRALTCCGVMPGSGRTYTMLAAKTILDRAEYTYVYLHTCIPIPYIRNNHTYPFIHVSCRPACLHVCDSITTLLLSWLLLCLFQMLLLHLVYWSFAAMARRGWHVVAQGCQRRDTALCSKLYAELLLDPESRLHKVLGTGPFAGSPASFMTLGHQTILQDKLL